MQDSDDLGYAARDEKNLILQIATQLLQQFLCAEGNGEEMDRIYIAKLQSYRTFPQLSFIQQLKSTSTYILIQIYINSCHFYSCPLMRRVYVFFIFL